MKCLVLWDDMMHERNFASFRRAEKFARQLVTRGDAKPRDVEIFGPAQGCIHLFIERLARIDVDALGRVWTDMTDEGVRRGC